MFPLNLTNVVFYYVFVMSFILFHYINKIISSLYTPYHTTLQQPPPPPHHTTPHYTTPSPFTHSLTHSLTFPIFSTSLCVFFCLHSSGHPFPFSSLAHSLPRSLQCRNIFSAISSVLSLPAVRVIMPPTDYPKRGLDGLTVSVAAEATSSILLGPSLT